MEENIFKITLENRLTFKHQTIELCKKTSPQSSVLLRIFHYLSDSEKRFFHLYNKISIYLLNPSIDVMFQIIQYQSEDTLKIPEVNTK